MTEIIWHGRGGQGAFTAAKLLGAAYVSQGDGHYALAFPSFGPERRGAPIRAFVKLSDRTIGDRSETEKADISVYLDETLFSEASFSELKDGGRIILNTKRHTDDERIITLDGDKIASEILKLPITNTVMLGAVAEVLGTISSDSVERAIRDNMPEKLWKRNSEAARAAAKEVRR